MRKYNLKIAAAVCALMMTLAVADPAGAVTRYVPSPYPTIQGAIDASAMTGDEIEVAPGTYNEAINFHGKAIRLYSSGGSGVTTINGAGHYHVVQCISGEDANTILEGFTITGGNADGTEPNDRRGGGMFNYNSSPTVIYCTFYKNSTGNGQDCAYPAGTGGTGGDGAGMYNLNSSPTVSYCTFEENSTGIGGTGGPGKDADPNPNETGGTGGTGGRGGNGAGMYNYNSSPAVNDCTFKENSTGIGGIGGVGGKGSEHWFNPGWGGYGGTGGNGGNGAGIFNSNSLPTLENCIFISNKTGKGNTGGHGGEGGCLICSDGDGGIGGSGGDGAGIYNLDSSATLINCSFSENTTGDGCNGFDDNPISGKQGGNGGHGAGMFNFNNSRPIVKECTFVKNKTGNGGKGGNGNIYVEVSIAGNGGNGGDGAGMVNTGGSSPILIDCSFTKNTTGRGGDGGLCLEGGSGGRAGHGAGMYCSNNSSPTVSKCIFEENVCGNGGNGTKGADQYVCLYADPKGFKGGSGGGGGNGAGMCNITNCSPTVSNSIFRNNKGGDGGCGGEGGSQYGFTFSLIHRSATPGQGGNGGHGGAGGGMYSYSSNPHISECEFRENKSGSGNNGGKAGGNYLSFNPKAARGGNGGDGGTGAGICFSQCSSADVNGCAFFDNETGSGGLGGSGTFAGIRKAGKKEPGANGTGGLGGGIGSYQSSPVVVNCTFRLNTAWYGGGMTNEHYSNSILTNCTFTKNLGKASGGGMYISASSPTVTNSIFWKDAPNEIAGTDPNVTYCDVKMPSGTFPGTGNINADPMFADDAGRLLVVSACINAGSNSAPNLPAKDFDGNPRIKGATVDMGAFEYTDLRIRNETKDLLYATIQAAIDDANDGDEICVLPGTYNEAIDFKGKAVRLYSTSGPQFTTINGNGAYHVVQCVSGEDPNTILEGFTITGGNANVSSASYDRGGGMYNRTSSPTIINCTFYENTAISYGGGMFNYTSSPTVTDCTFSGNSARYGGGIYNYADSNPTVTNCTFSGNTSDYEGGGMYNNSSNPTVTNCTFSRNTADYYYYYYYGGGGGMHNSGSSPTVINCTFSENMALIDGGGMYNNYYSSPTLTNCTFSGNSANSGGGMYNYRSSNPTVTNCTFRYNHADFGSGMCNYNCNPIVTNCILWGDSLNEIYNYESTPIVTYSDVQGGYPGAGNINADPGFSLAIIDGRYECSIFLSSSPSPCVDAGDNNAPNLPDTDRGGQPRVIDGDVDGNSTVDMGAYEFQPCVKNVTRNRWYQLIQHSVEDACDYDRIEVSPGTYYESINLTLAPNNFVLTSIDPNDPNIVEQTIIDAKFGGDVIHFWSQEPSCIVAGFTLTQSVVNPMMNPNLGYGIGSYIEQTNSPTITNCVITNTTGVNFGNGTSVISGCTIRDNFGGVMTGYNAIVEDSTIANNFAIGGIVFYNAVKTSLGNTILRRCVVSGNLCEYAAISCGDNTTIEDCVISDNSGRGISGMSAGKISGCTINNNKEGGISFWPGPIENCTITGNGPLDYFGGGIEGCTGPITGCLIERNEAWNGGGLASCSGPITNCIIAANRARSQYGGYGGGLVYCNGTISNCTIVGNVAWNNEFENPGLGGGLYECSGTITNCIIRQNVAQADGDQLYSSSVPSYSCIQDWPGGGVGNIADDPCFVYAGYWADFNDPNTVVEPNDPNAVWVDGFYRLNRNSPCIDAGDNNSVPDDISDLDADGDVNEPVPFDLGGLPRFIEDLCTVDSGNPGTPGPPVVDMGAYEFLPADIDSSGAVNLYDLSMLALHLGETGCGRCGGANLNCDGKVDFNDLRLLTDWWLAGIEPEL